MINTIILGHALNILPQLPAESVSCVTSSPPYWGLRDYGVKPVIWDGDKDCKHEWGDNIPCNKESHHGEGRSTLRNGNVSPDENWNSGIKGKKPGSNFCQKCGAWRGSLGLEPDFNLYVKHLCDIFDGVKRVLRKDGICWVNVGDSYGGSGNASGHREDTKNLGYKTLEMGATQGNQKTTRQYAKCLLDIPYRFSIEMTNRGWVKRNTIIWYKKNCMPSSANDRFTIDFEYLFFFTKSNKVLFWTNEKTLECVDKKPPGIKGIEGKDWEWRKVGMIDEGSPNQRVRDIGKGALQKATEEEIENYGKPKRKKMSLWTGHDYWFDQQFEKQSLNTHFKGIKPRTTDKFKDKSKRVDNKVSHKDWHEYTPLTELPRGRNKRCVWIISTQPFPEAHFAVYPEELIEIPIKAGCPEFVCKKCGKARVKIYEKQIDFGTERSNTAYKGLNAGSLAQKRQAYRKLGYESPPRPKEIGYSDCGCNAGWESGIVLDPFMGAGTTALVALKQRKRFIGIEIKQEYIDMSYRRIANVQQRIF